MILLSIIENTDGSSTRILSMDGETGEPVNDHELFHAWAGLADKLAQSRELDPGRREFAAQVMSVIRGAYRAMRGA